MENSKKTVRSFASPEYLAILVKNKYGFTEVEYCKPLKLGGSNDIYILCAENKKYIVKVYSKRECWSYTREHYLFELKLQSFLTERNFPAPKPIVNIRGELLEEIEFPEGEKYLAMYSYVPGDKWDHKLSKDQRLRKLGVKVAEFHKLAAAYETDHHVRKLDMDQLLDKSWHRINTLVLLPNDKIKCKLHEMYQKIKETTKSCQLNKSNLFLIHGDVHAGNNLYDSKTKELSLLDFELCGYGYLGYEFATLKWDLLNSHKNKFVERCMDEFFLGYTTVNTLGQKILNDVDMFVKIRHFFMLGSSFLFYPDRPQLNSPAMLNYYINKFNNFI
jgi:Ser/Thr protein kinase RdoA (MazF antagonist)